MPSKYNYERGFHMTENTNEMQTNVDESVYEKPYLVKDGCLYEEVTTKNKTEHVKLADFVPVLKSEVTYDDGTEPKKMFKVAATHRTGEVMPEQLVSADEMMSMKWMLQRWGKNGSAVPKQSILARISHAIMHPKAEPDHETIYAQTGWKKIGGRYKFLMPNENSPYTVELQGKLSSYVFTEKCSPDDLVYLSAMLDNVIAPAKVMLPMLAVTFLSPLNHFLKEAGCEPKFVTALIGKTGSRKSTLAALFLSFFGRFTASDLPMSFHDTANSILANTYYLKDILTCIDDYHPAGIFQERDMQNTAQSISRYYGDRAGRGRLNSQIEIQASKPPTGNALITAEFAPDISVSGAARYFNIELGENEVNLKDLTEYQQYAEQGILTGMMQTYTDWLGKIYLSDEKDFERMLSALFRQSRKEYTAKISERKIKCHSRVPDMLSHLKIGLTMLLIFLQEHNLIGEADRKQTIEKFDEIVLRNAADNAALLLEQDPVTKFCDKLIYLLESGRCYVDDRAASSGAAGKGYIGMEDSENYYLLADAVHCEVKKQCADQGEHFSISKFHLIKQLAADGLLTKFGQRNTTTVRTATGQAINVIVMPKAAIGQRLSRDLCPPSPSAESLPEPLPENAAQGNVAQV